MRHTLFLERYPVFSLEIGKDETGLRNIGEVVAYLREQVEAHPAAIYIATFDHHAHTTSLPEGQVAPDILAATNLVFCFGLTLPEPGALALRPRSIGVAELEDRFVVNFLEAPMPVANSAMEAWALSLRDRPLASTGT